MLIRWILRRVSDWLLANLHWDLADFLCEGEGAFDERRISLYFTIEEVYFLKGYNLYKP